MPLMSATLQGDFLPLSGTFSIHEPEATYSWISGVASYSDEQYLSAAASRDPTYTQLPDGLPTRIRNLALAVTARHSTPYGKAKALEQHLRTQYAYEFASTVEDVPPPGRDPVDWFLFDQQAGTCGSFSTAFAVMARSVGIPARVVSGWVVLPTADPQTVESSQAHQWAEVPLEGIGWVRFEPTASGGAPTRVGEAADFAVPTVPVVPVPVDQREPADPPATQEGQPFIDTVTTITRWPPQIRRKTPFSVGGTVTTVAGGPVSGVTVEVYLNETKEHGGTTIGVMESRLGAFEASVEIPADLDLGDYQLLARTVPNEGYNESWSDPDITVVSMSGLEISGSSEVPVDVEAAFRGRLSDDSGEGRAGYQIGVTIDGDPVSSVTTGSEGGFSFTRSFSETGPHWVEVTVQGDEFLMGNYARLDFVVTLPTEIEISAPVTVEVGSDFRVAGKLQDAGGQPLPGESLTARIAGVEETVFTGASGEFDLTGNADTAGRFFVEAEFAGRPTALPSRAAVRLLARHTLGLTLDAPDDFPSDGESTITGSVTSPTLASVGQLQLTVEDAEGGQLAAVTTAEDGSFELTLTVEENLQASPLVIRYGGDDLHMPVSYFLNVTQEETSGPNWLLLLGVLAATTVAVTGALVGRRVLARRLVSVIQREPADGIREAEETIEATADTGLEVHGIEVRFAKPAPDLPDVWGVGERVDIEVGIAGSDGQSIGGATVQVAILDAEVSSELTTDESGTCSLGWTAGQPGEYEVTAVLAGDVRSPSVSASRSLRAVDFRDEIVRLYNVFLDWAKERSAGIHEQSTPREVELTLVDKGLAADQKALDDVISQFEEADYSEHPIVRRHYETMYRAWHKIVQGDSQ